MTDTRQPDPNHAAKLDPNSPQYDAAYAELHKQKCDPNSPKYDAAYCAKYGKKG